MSTPKPPQKRIHRREATLWKALGDISWEWKQLCITYALIANASDPLSHEDAAALESFIIHARNLRDFFYGPPNHNKLPERPTAGHADDMLANDFFSIHTDWDSVRPAETRLLKQLNKRANKHLGHLTYSRLLWKSPSTPPSQSTWKVGLYYRDLREVLECFMQHVDRIDIRSRPEI